MASPEATARARELLGEHYRCNESTLSCPMAKDGTWVKGVVMKCTCGLAEKRLAVAAALEVAAFAEATLWRDTVQGKREHYSDYRVAVVAEERDAEWNRALVEAMDVGWIPGSRTARRDALRALKRPEPAEGGSSGE